MSQPDFQVEWAVDRDHEVACGGSAIAGGLLTGDAVFSDLGESQVEASAAWNVGNLKDSAEQQPVGPAGGPVAPVLAPGEYPHAFAFDPRIADCGSGLSATGTVRITVEDGDQIHGTVRAGRPTVWTS